MRGQPQWLDEAEDLSSLAVRARAERAAADDLVRQTQQHVQRFATSFAGRSLADDVVQETYIRALRSLGRYDEERPFLPWLLTIARRAAVDLIRSEERRREVLPAAPQPVGFAAERDLHGLVRSLEPKRRAAFVLTQVMGYDYEEAARICRVPVGTIRSRVHRARTELVAQLR